jgi:hypothetical protein
MDDLIPALLEERWMCEAKGLDHRVNLIDAELAKAGYAVEKPAPKRRRKAAD